MVREPTSFIQLFNQEREIRDVQVQAISNVKELCHGEFLVSLALRSFG